MPRSDYPTNHDGRVRADVLREKFGWSTDTFWTLLDFPLHVLAKNRNSSLRAEQIKVLKRIRRDLRKVDGKWLYPSPLSRKLRVEKERGEERIFVPVVFEPTHDLREEVAACSVHLERSTGVFSTIPKGLKPLPWIIWNLAPFFKHTDRTATRHVGNIAWSDMVRFLDAAPGSHLFGIRRNPGKVSESGLDLLTLEAERFKGIYERLKKKATAPGFDSRLTALLINHQNRSPLETVHRLVEAKLRSRSRPSR